MLNKYATEESKDGVISCSVYVNYWPNSIGRPRIGGVWTSVAEGQEGMASDLGLGGPTHVSYHYGCQFPYLGNGDLTMYPVNI